MKNPVISYEQYKVENVRQLSYDNLSDVIAKNFQEAKHFQAAK